MTRATAVHAQEDCRCTPQQPRLGTKTNPFREGAVKNTLLKIAAAVAGITLALCIAAASVFWYATRPKPQKPWDDKAIVPTANTAGFGPTDNKDYELVFTYQLKNSTLMDYSVDDSKSLKIVGLAENNVLTQPIPSDAVVLSTPIFIPSQQTSAVGLRIKLPIPSKMASESDDAYHERLRSYLNDKISFNRGFAVFDEINHYRIDLPTWSRTTPAKNQRSASPSEKSPETFVGATKAYMGFVYTFDGGKWVKGSEARKYNEKSKSMDKWSDDQYDPIGLWTKEEKSKRTLSKDQIQLVANQFEVSYEDAKAEAKEQGYLVPAD